MLAVIGDSANAASIGVHRALGFVHAGTMRPPAGSSIAGSTSSSCRRALGPGDATAGDRAVSATPAALEDASRPGSPLLGGSLGLHRFYLHGARDAWAWLHPWPTLVGAYGFWRLRSSASTTRSAAGSLPLLGGDARERACSPAHRLRPHARPSAGATASARRRRPRTGWADGDRRRRRARRRRDRARWRRSPSPPSATSSCEADAPRSPRSSQSSSQTPSA